MKLRPYLKIRVAQKGKACQTYSMKRYEITKVFLPPEETGKRGRPRTEKADDAEQGTLSESSESAISNWRRWRPMRENMKWRKSSKEDINLFQAIWELLQ